MSTNPETIPLKNVRVIHALAADAPANFSAMAEDAKLRFIEEPAEWGTRYVIDFADLDTATPTHPLVRQLTAIGAENRHDEFSQIWLETK